MSFRKLSEYIVNFKKNHPDLMGVLAYAAAVILVTLAILFLAEKALIR